MIQAFRNAIKIPELRKRLIFTALLLIVYRVGAHITLPGIDDDALARFFTAMSDKTGGMLGFVDIFSGGAFSQMTIFALGIQPYISASIIIQLLTVVVPHLERLSKEGEQGRKKITQYTRYGTVVLGAVQAFGISFLLRNPSQLASGLDNIVTIPGLSFSLLAMLTLMAGTAFVMWLGEQITDRGIGNGISLIITVGIIASVPQGIAYLVNAVTNEAFNMDLIRLVLFLASITLMIMAVIFITLAVRKIPVQYSRRVVGRRMYGGQATHIPLRVNAAGMIPIIFAMVIMQFPQALVSFVPLTFVQTIAGAFYGNQALYYSSMGLLVIFFTYFYTAVQINPVQMADDLKKYGGFIPGQRPGRQTAQFIENCLDRITLPGAVYLAAITVLPMLFQSALGIQGSQVSGASIIIVVGVMLDTVQQIESYLVTRHYDGFLKGTRLKGRRR